MISQREVQRSYQKLMHFVNGEWLWCYETYKEVEAMLNAELK